MNPTGMWWAAMPREYWDQTEGQRPDQKPDWHPRYGDRIQMLVFIGQEMDEDAIRARLDSCLLDKELASADSDAWAALENPFPDLEFDEEDAA